MISRFKEREETVKGDIFNVYVTILQQTRPLITKSGKFSTQSLNGDQNGLQLVGAQKKSAFLVAADEEKPVQSLKSQMNAIVKALQKLLKHKSAKTRQGCFSLLIQLVNVLPGALSAHLAQIMPGVNYSLNDKTSTSNMKIDTLNFLNNLLMTHDEKLFHSYLDLLVRVSCFFFCNNISFSRNGIFIYERNLSHLIN